MFKKIKHTKEFFFYSRDEILKNLKNNKEYQKCKEERDRLWDEYPILMKLFEEKNMEQTVELTEKQQKAIRRFVELQGDMQDMVEREQYYRGHRDCLLYLLRSGIFEAE